MQANIHPHYHKVSFKCSCGNIIKVNSTLNKEEQHIDVCGQCHPFYTGKQKLVDTGRVNKFRAKYAKKTSSPTDESTKNR